MPRHTEPVRSHVVPKPRIEYRPADGGASERCLGAAAQVAAIHRTLRGALPLKLETGGPVLYAEGSGSRSRGRGFARPLPGNSGKEVAQAKLIYPKVDLDEQAKTRKEFSADRKTLRNAAEPLSIEALAANLNQDITLYTPGEAAELKGEPLNYMVGHVYGTKEEPFWGSVGPKQIATDFLKGQIQAGSTLKLIGCKGADGLGPQLAAALGHGIAVIANPGIVHATGQGITAFPDDKQKMSKEQIAVFNRIKKQSDALNSSITKLQDKVAAARKEIERLREEYSGLSENEQQADVEDKYHDLIQTKVNEVNAIKQAFKQAAGSFFESLVTNFNAFYGKEDAFATTEREGWLKFVGSEAPAALGAADEAARGPIIQQLQLDVQQLQIVASQPLGSSSQAAASSSRPSPPQTEVAVQQPQRSGARSLTFVDATHDHPLI
jgi:hypothetical protein